MSKIVFIQFGDTRQLELKIDGDSTWMTVAEEFVSFLQGCGYQVTGADVADYLTEVYGSTQYGLEDFDFSETTTYGGEDVNMTLDDVMHVWGNASSNDTETTNTITITTL